MTTEKLKEYRDIIAELKDPTTSKERRQELSEKKREIDEFVKNVPYKIRKPILMYYIDPIGDGELRPTWESVADKLGGGVLSFALKSRVNKFIRSTEK